MGRRNDAVFAHMNIFAIVGTELLLGFRTNADLTHEGKGHRGSFFSTEEDVVRIALRRSCQRCVGACVCV